MSTIKSSDEHLTLNADGSSKDIKLQSNGSEKVTIKSTGNVGIGETNPDASLHITSNTPIISFDESDASQEYRVGSFGGTFAIYDSTDSAYRVAVDGDGNVGIGTTSPSSYYSKNLVIAAEDNGGMTIVSDSTTDSGMIMFADGTGASAYRGQFGYDHNIDSFGFWTNATSAMFIHSTGGVSVGTATSIGSGNLLVNDGIYISSSNGDYQIRGNSTGGGSATLYIGNRSIDTTASDARFKDVIGDCTNGLEIVKALKVKDYTWKEGFDNDTTTVMSGLLAQEVELIDPSLVTKPTPKEAVEAVEEVRDADGNITTEAVKAVEAVNASDEGWSVKYQMIVPKLIQAIQELEARITALES